MVAFIFIIHSESMKLLIFSTKSVFMFFFIYYSTFFTFILNKIFNNLDMNDTEHTFLWSKVSFEFHFVSETDTFSQHQLNERS